MEPRIHSFPPVADGAARLLILGTMPSEASLRDGFYYAHPRNCFWPMMAQILGRQKPASVEEKCAMLTARGIALWDVAQSCVRPGSLDSDIRDAAPSDIPGLLGACPGIEAIFFNGGTAMRLFHRLLPDLRGTRREVLLPSTSPAHTMTYERKLLAWAGAIRPWIEEEG